MKTFKNPISTAMSEYREDFRYNKEWWAERMGTGNNNEYLYIQFKNGDTIVIQSDYFQLDGNTCLPRFRAEEVAYISRYYGDQCETTTANNIVVDTDRIILYRDGVEYFRYEMTEEEYKEMRRQIWELDENIDATAWMLDYCRALATSKMNNRPEPTNPDNTPSAMNANEINAPEFSELSHAAQCLDIYLHNTREIYDRYTVPAIKKVAAMMRSNATHPQQFDVSSAGVSGLWEVIRAISAAVGLVRKYDKLAPTQDDKKHVIRNYAAYIVDCAKYEIETA